MQPGYCTASHHYLGRNGTVTLNYVNINLNRQDNATQELYCSHRNDSQLRTDSNFQRLRVRKKPVLSSAWLDSESTVSLYCLTTWVTVLGQPLNSWNPWHLKGRPRF